MREFLEYYHRERNHQGLCNRLIVPGEEVDQACCLNPTPLLPTAQH